MTKARLYDIIITALIGAGIAFLQSLLTAMTGTNIPHTDPSLAGIAAGAIKLMANKSLYS